MAKLQIETFTEKFMNINMDGQGRPEQQQESGFIRPNIVKEQQQSLIDNNNNHKDNKTATRI